MRPGFLLVATREIRRLYRDKVALFLLLGVPLIAFFVLSLTFSNPVIRGLGTVVVDGDRTPTSAIFVQAIAAAPGIALRQQADNLTAAMQAVRSGRAIASVYIPENFERDVMAGRRPQITIFYNTQFLTPGNAAFKALNDAVQGAVASIAPRLPETPQTMGSLVVEQYVLTNPALNYAQFLLRAILPMVLHVVIAIASCYAVGSEFSRGTFRGWMQAAGGSPLIALTGKLAPLFAVFVLQMALLVPILHSAYGIPFRGDAPMLALAACLLIAAYQGLAALLVLLVRNLALGLSLTGIVVSPAFGYAGVGFPIFGMLAFAKGWGAILPLTWYMRILVDQAARGAPPYASAMPLLILAGMAIGYGGFAWLRLSALAGRHRQSSGKEAVTAVIPGRGFVGSIIGEIRYVFADRSVMGLMFIAPILYGVFYPQPYLGQTLRHLPIAVVDHDGTELSRQITMTLDSDEAVAIAERSDTLAEAQQALYQRRVFGILEIPAGTTRDFLKGDMARLPVYVDSGYFLVFSRTYQGLAESVGAVALGRLSHDAREGGIGKSLIALRQPVDTLAVPLFNPTGGYASYVVPAAFILILQQTLLMGAAMLSGVAFETGGRRAQLARGSFQAVLAQGLAHLVIYIPALLLFLVILPRIYGFSTLGRLPDLVVFAVTFILATSFLGQAVGAWFKHRETAVVLFIATSLPQFFLVGLSWPVEAIPPVMRWFGQIFPSEAAIDGMVRINQMGASLADVSRDWVALLALLLGYFLVAVTSTHLRQRASHAV
jgi:ABC-2 type transport system permease protein